MSRPTCSHGLYVNTKYDYPFSSWSLFSPFSPSSLPGLFLNPFYLILFFWQLFLTSVFAVILSLFLQLVIFTFVHPTLPRFLIFSLSICRLIFSSRLSSFLIYFLLIFPRSFLLLFPSVPVLFLISYVDPLGPITNSDTIIWREAGTLGWGISLSPDLPVTKETV